MNRNDIQGGPSVPKAITEYLLRKEGKNIFGEPNFRLVWSPARLTKKGGKFSDWDKNIAAHERGGLIRLQSGLLIPNGHTPIRTVIEVREVKKYTFDAGWVLERWIPASYYGGRGDWDARVVPGTTIPFGGPYPETGDYEMCHNTASIEIPSIAQLQNAIDRCNYAREHHQANAHQAYIERMNRYAAEYEAEQKKEKAETEAFIRDLMSPVFSQSITAGVWRGKVARSIGITEHVGN